MAKKNREVGPQVEADGGGLRYNDGKPDFALLPPEFITALAQHNTVGSRKYARRNWERGMAVMTCFACLMRHAWLWARGYNYDQETGSHLMISVAWNAMAIYTYFVRGIGKDDRHVVQAQQEFWLEPEAPELQPGQTPK